MGTVQTEHALRRMREHAERAHFADGASDAQIARAEERLGVEFPPSYRRFLAEVGAARFDDQVIFGVAGDERTDVVEATLDQRARGNLPDTHVIVGPYGEEAFFGFDCADRRNDGECPVAEIPRDWGDIQEPNFFADDFGSFLLRRVRDQLGEHGAFEHP